MLDELSPDIYCLNKSFEPYVEGEKDAEAKS